MTSDENTYTPEFKREVAQKALDQSKQNLEKLSEEYDVPVSVILMWATELEKGGPQVFEEEPEGNGAEKPSEVVNVEISDEEVASSIDHGVMFDDLNYNRLIFWSILGLVIVVIFVQSLLEMYQYNTQAVQERISAESGEYYQSAQLKKDARNQLNSFGVVNLEEGVYRMPIDSVIDNMAAKEE